MSEEKNRKPKNFREAIEYMIYLNPFALFVFLASVLLVAFATMRVIGTGKFRSEVYIDITSDATSRAKVDSVINRALKEEDVSILHISFK